MNYFVYPEIIQADFYKFCNKTYTGNVRMYDPALGRFLSPDPFMQDPSNTQNFNRYSYCLNNPLKFIDPSGFTYSGASGRNQTQISNIEGINKWLQYDWYYWFQSLDKVRDRITWGKSYHGGEGTALTHYLLCYDYISIISIDGSSYEKRYYNQDVISTRIENSSGALSIINRISSLPNENAPMETIELSPITICWNGQPGSAHIVGDYPDINTYNSNELGNTPYTMYYATEVAFPLVPGATIVTSTTVGNGSVHMRSVNGGTPYPIRSLHSESFTYEVEEKEGGTKSLSLSIKKYYISVGYGENGVSIGSGVNKGNFSIGHEQKMPRPIFKALILLYLPELAPRIAPTLIPLNSIRYSW